ncbi:MAG TPA: PAAR domain-containing protein [Acidiphilium sp.]|nr:PAAR domain-containing protein [Acidiphilium sp.]HQT89623.1 PAAR domain-containing protein [Acidiphilium sp.]
MHTCPDTDGPVPHIGGPITSGSPNVFIGGLPAARVTDPLTCVGPPDTIVMGSQSVLINGLPAARMGDQTAHGGVIVGGLTTVLIGTAGSASSVVDTALGLALDGAAQALVMVQAAASGKAFCAVCLGL